MATFSNNSSPYGNNTQKVRDYLGGYGLGVQQGPLQAPVDPQSSPRADSQYNRFNFGPSVYGTNPNGSSGGPAPIYAPQVFNGVTYDNPEDLAAAQHEFYQGQYGRNLNLLNDTHNSGLLTFQQRQQQLDQTDQNLGNQRIDLGTGYENSLNQLGQGRDQTINSQSGYFSSVSPNARQSQQDVLEGKVQDQYQNSLGTLNTQRDRNNQSLDQATANQDLNRQQYSQDFTNFGDQYQNQLQTLDQDLQNNTDQGTQGVLDYQNLLKNFASQQNAVASANTTQYDPVALLQGYQQYIVGAQNTGIPNDQIQAQVLQQLKAKGLNQDSINGIMQALYPGLQGTPQPTENIYGRGA